MITPCHLNQNRKLFLWKKYLKSNNMNKWKMTKISNSFILRLLLISMPTKNNLSNCYFGSLVMVYIILIWQNWTQLQCYYCKIKKKNNPSNGSFIYHSKSYFLLYIYRYTKTTIIHWINQYNRRMENENKLSTNGTFWRQGI